MSTGMRGPLPVAWEPGLHANPLRSRVRWRHNWLGVLAGVVALRCGGLGGWRRRPLHGSIHNPALTMCHDLVAGRAALDEEVARATELFSHMNMSKSGPTTPARSRFGAGAGASAGQSGAGAGGADAGASRVIPRPDYWGGCVV